MGGVSLGVWSNHPVSPVLPHAPTRWPHPIPILSPGDSPRPLLSARFSCRSHPPPSHLDRISLTAAPATPAHLLLTSTGASGGVVLPGVGASLGKICREHISGKCTKGTDCRFSHPPQQLLMSVMAATISVSTLGHAPMAPSAAAMAAAQAIMAAQAHAAEMQVDAKAAAQAPDQLGSILLYKEGIGEGKDVIHIPLRCVQDA